MTGDEQPNDTRFKLGQSGNAKGRPTGSRSKVLVALDALGEGEVEDIVKVQIEKAKGGDSMAAKTILDNHMVEADQRPHYAPESFADCGIGLVLARKQRSQRAKQTCEIDPCRHVAIS